MSSPAWSSLFRGLGGALLAAVALLPIRAATVEPIKIGEIESLTGKEAAFGQASHRGIKMAVEEINARGGLLGRPVQLITDDNQSKPGESATIAKKLISRDRVVAVLNGSSTNSCLESAPVCQNGKIPMVATTATSQKVTEFGNYVFRNCFIDPFQGKVLSKFILNSLKLKRAAVLASVSSPFSVGLADAFRGAFLAGGGTIAGEQKYNDGEKDFRAQLTAIRSLNPEVIVVTGFYTEGGLILRQARELGLKCPLVSGDGWEAPELIETAGPAANGAYYSSHYSAESTAPEVRAFLEKFKAKYHEAPESAAPLAYDGMMILADAIRRAGKVEAAAIRDALAATKDYPGVTGRTTIDAQRNASKPAVMLRVEGGKAKYAETVYP